MLQRGGANDRLAQMEIELVRQFEENERKRLTIEYKAKERADYIAQLKSNGELTYQFRVLGQKASAERKRRHRLRKESIGTEDERMFIFISKKPILPNGGRSIPALRGVCCCLLLLAAVACCCCLRRLCSFDRVLLIDAWLIVVVWCGVQRWSVIRA